MEQTVMKNSSEQKASPSARRTKDEGEMIQPGLEPGSGEVCGFYLLNQPGDHVCALANSTRNRTWRVILVRVTGGGAGPRKHLPVTNTAAEEMVQFLRLHFFLQLCC
jgi:hypothetical protein